MIRPTTNALLIGLLVATPVAVIYTPQSAEARPSTRSYSCSGVRSYVRRKGAVVMNTKNSRIYRRFVANRSYCYPRESLKRFSVPTKSGRCSLNICYEYDFDDVRGFGGRGFSRY